MNQTMIGAFAIAALIAIGPAFAADAPPAASSAPTAAASAAPAAPAMPPAASSTPAATPTTAPAVAPEAAATPAPVAATPAPAPAPMAAMPAKMEKPHVSACTRAIRSAEHDLRVSKAKPEAIAGAWQHIQAAKQARAMHKRDACKSEAAAASKMSSMM